MAGSVVASWVTAVGTAGSLLGFAAYVWVMLLNRRDEGQVRQEQEAQGVAAWLDSGQRHDWDDSYVLAVHNGGVAPVYQCRLKIHMPYSDMERVVWLAILPPGSTAVRALPFDSAELDENDIYSASSVPELRFTDSRGGHWQRDRDGMLKRVDGKGPRIRPLGMREPVSRDDRQWERHDSESQSTT